MTMETVDKRDFNIAAKVFLGLAMVSLIMGCVTNLINYSTYSKLGLGSSQSHLIIEAIFNVLLVVAAVLIFARKKYALVAFVVLAFIRMFATIPQGTDVSTSYYLGGKTVILLRDIGLFCLAMFFKKNGITGWQAFFADDEFIESHFQTAEEQAAEQAISSDSSSEPKEPIVAAVEEAKAEETKEEEAVANVETAPVVDEEHFVEEKTPEPEMKKEVEAPTISQIVTPKQSPISTSPITTPAPSIQVENEHEAKLQKRITELEEENARLKEMYAELALEHSLLKKKK